MEAEAKIRDILIRKKALVESAPDPDDKPAQAEFKRQMAELNLEEKQITRETKVQDAELQAEQTENSANIDNLAKEITDKIREIRASDMTEDDKLEAISELPDIMARNAGRDAQEAGDEAFDNERAKQELKQAEDRKKINDDILKEEDRVRKQRANAKKAADVLNIGSGTRCTHCGLLHFMWRETCGSCRKPMNYNMGVKE